MESMRTRFYAHRYFLTFAVLTASLSIAPLRPCHGQEAVAGVEYKAKDGLVKLRDGFQGKGQLPQMVFIQMYVFEVSLEDDKELGLIHRLQNPDGGSTGAELGDLRNPSHVDLGVLQPVNNGLAQGISLEYVTLDQDDGRIVTELQAFAGHRRATTYATPFILTLSGEPAAIATGDEVPYLSRALAGDKVVFDELFLPTGVNLMVNPTVKGQSMIGLDINLSLKSVSRFRNEQGFQQPILQSSEFQTNFDLKSGSSVLLGGVLRRVKVVTETGVPYAQDIPLLGRLFRGTVEDVVRTELLIIVNPLIVDMTDYRNFQPNRSPGPVVERLQQRADELQETEPPLDQIYDLLLEKPLDER